MLETHSKRPGVYLAILAMIVVLTFVFARISIGLRQTPTQSIRYGITYSTIYASYLGLDPINTYHDLVENLGVRVVRLPVYWSEIEPKKDQYDWNQLDRLVKYSEAHQVKLTLAIGQKVPRWPECFIPGWALKRSDTDQQKDVLEMLRTVVTRYRDSVAVEKWQIENEPFLPFGVCQQMSETDVQEEIALVRSLDARPVQITASGEMGPWGPSANMSDVLGISVYRMTWNNIFGYFTYPLSPLFYRVRTWPIFASGKSVIVSELQAEPWFSEDVKSQSTSYWYNVFTAEDFAENIRFVKELGVPEVDLWGAEWWVYLKQHGETRLWDAAQKLFSSE